MSESIAEMKIPGTYIEVRAEGLIAVGAISTGNIGIVGTAGRGSGQPGAGARLAGRGHRPVRPAPTRSRRPRVTDSPLTLVRALEQAFAGGARNVFAVRAANGDADGGLARHPRRRRPRRLHRHRPRHPRRRHRDRDRRVVGHVGPRHRTSTSSPDTSAADVRFRMTVSYRERREVFEGANGRRAAHRRERVDVRDVGPGSNIDAAVEPVSGNLAGGTDGADASASDLGDALAVLEDQPVNILLVAGVGVNVIGNVGRRPPRAHRERGPRAHRRSSAPRASGTATTALRRRAGRRRHRRRPHRARRPRPAGRRRRHRPRGRAAAGRTWPPSSAARCRRWPRTSA